MDLPFGFILMGLSLISLGWGIACAVIGGMVRFNLEKMLNDYLKHEDTSYIYQKSSNIIKAPNEFTEVDFGNAVQVIGIIAILAGVLAVIYGLVGLMAGILKNVSLLFIFIGCVMVSVMLQFTEIYLCMSTGSTIHGSARDNLAQKVKEEYRLGDAANNFAHVLNSVMIRAECCGVSGPNDFENITAQYKGQPQILQVSPACCKKQIWKSPNPLVNAINCGLKPTPQNSYRSGCYDRMHEIAYNSKMGTYVVLIFLIVAIQCVEVGLAVLMVFQPKEDEKADTGPADQEEVQLEEKKEFAPFSKLSSFPTQDVNRMRSTEIW